MAATESSGQKTIAITSIDADWTCGAEIGVFSIMFIPGAANDEVVIKDATDAGVIIGQMLSTDGEPRIIYYHHRMTPMIDFSACTLSANHQVIIRKI